MITTSVSLGVVRSRPGAGSVAAALALHAAVAMALLWRSGVEPSLVREPAYLAVEFVGMAAVPAIDPTTGPQSAEAFGSDPTPPISAPTPPLIAAMPLPPPLRPVMRAQVNPAPNPGQTEDNAVQSDETGPTPSLDVRTPAASMPDAAKQTAPPPAEASQPLDPRYLVELADRLRRAQRYPVAARRLQQEGRVQLKLSLAADGTLIGCEVDASSGYELLDRAALDMARRVTPMPPFPSQMGSAPLTMTVPVVFSLRTTP